MAQQVSWNRNLYLAIALCVLGGFAFWLEYKHKPAQEAAQDTLKKVFALKGEQIESIQLSDGSKTFKWECQDLQAKTCKPGDNSKWKLAEPLQVRADDSNVNSLVSALSNLAPSETIDLKDETPEKRSALLKEYGLSPEAIQGPNVKRVDVKASNGETVAYIGAVNPINDNFFAVLERVPAGQKPAGKPDDSKVIQIPSYFKSNFEHDLTYWRDKKIMSLAASEVQSFEILSKKNGKIHGEKKDGGWVITSGDTSFEGDPEMVDALLNGAAYLAAKNYVSDSKTDAKAKSTLKGQPEIVSVTFTQAPQAGSKNAPSSVTLTLYSNRKNTKGAPKPEMHVHDHEHELNQGASPDSTPVYATLSNTDPLYELQSNAPRQFDKELKDFRMAKLLTSLDRFSIKKIELSGKAIGDKPLALDAKDTKWIDAASQTEVNSEKVQSFLDQFSGRHIQDFLPDSKVPAGEKDGLKITLGDDQNPAKHVFVFWKADGKLYARNLSSARKEAFLVDSTLIDGLPWSRDFFKK
ncbi:MAG: DUF4340 domain-containing protein [Bdellovibrionia bacterium]